MSTPQRLTRRTVCSGGCPARGWMPRQLRDSILSVCGRLDAAMGGSDSRGGAVSKPLPPRASRRARALSDRSAERLPSGPPRPLYDHVPGLRFPRPGRGQRRSHGDDGRLPGTFHDERPLMRSAPERPGEHLLAARGSRPRPNAAGRSAHSRPAGLRPGVSGWYLVPRPIPGSGFVKGGDERTPPDHGLAGPVQGNIFV